MADLGTFITGDPDDTPADGDTARYDADTGTYRARALTADDVPGVVREGDVLLNATRIAGVDPTGATESTAALNAWLADPPAGHDGLWFPPGLYVASLKVTTPGLTLRASRQAIIKVPDDAEHHVTDAGIRVLADNVTIDGLTIDGNQTGNPDITGLAAAENSDGIGIYADNCRVTGCHIYDPIGHGVIVWGLAYPSTGTAEKAAGPRNGTIISGNHIEGGSNRAALDVAFNQAGVGETRTVISGNIVEDNTTVLHSANDVAMTGNVLQGVSIHTRCERVVFTGNVASGHPVNIDSGRGVTVIGNTCQSLTVKPDTGTDRPYDVTVANNVVANTLTVSKSDRVTITGNIAGAELRIDDSTQVIASSNRQGSIVSTACTRISIYGNEADRIALAGATSRARIADNDIDASGENYGIILSGSDIQATGNRVGGAVIDGISVGGTAVTVSDVLVADNVVTDSGRFGINIGSNAATVRAQNNRSSGSGTSNLIVSSAATGVTLLNNGKSYARLVVPPASTLAQAAPTAWPSASNALLSRFSLTTETTLRHVRFQVGVSSGNIQAGVVRFTGATAYQRVMNSGVIPCPASGFVTLDLGAYDATIGDYAVFLWADNTTFTTPHIQSDVARAARLCSAVISVPGGMPASGNVYEPTNRTLLGVAIETDI